MDNQKKAAVVLVGHGGAPTDFPREKLARLKRLEGERAARGGGDPGAEEAELDRLIREWPRTPRSDPYKFGLEELARALSERLGGTRVLGAYNEFCGPSLESAVETLVSEGYGEVRFITTMFTRGGVHSECEIPYLVGQLKKRWPAVSFSYAWPFEPGLIADFLARQLEAAQGGGAR